MSSHDFNFGSSPYRTVSRQEERMEQHMASLEQEVDDIREYLHGLAEQLIETVRRDTKGHEKRFESALPYLEYARDELVEKQ